MSSPKARIHPDSDKTRVIFSSSAEEQFYQQCKETLGAGWQVYHSVTLSTMDGDQGLKDNEIDFVCYHPKFGIVVVEVKGGRIRHDGQTGVYYSLNRHGQSFEIKDPFQQALVWKSRFLRFLKASEIKVPVSHAVCFPAASEDEFPKSTGVVSEIIIGRNKIKDLETTFRGIVHKSQPEQYLTFQDVGGALDRVLIGSSFTTRLYLRDYINAHEGRMKDVEGIHETLITPIASAKRLGVEGEAGTGKTMLAVLLAKHFRDQGKSVVILGSNALLNLLLKRDLGEGIDAMTYPEIASAFGINLLIPSPDYKGVKEDWIQYEAPDMLKKAIAISPKRYEVVICDESQDVQPFWWDAIEGLLDHSHEDARFYLFFDSSQGVFGSGGGETKFIAGDVLPIKPPYFPLVHNYRTTREISTFARCFRTSDGVLQSHAGRLGYVPELVTYKDAADAKEILAKLVRKLTKEEGLGNDEITLLSARNPSAKESVLYQTEEIAKTPLYRLTSTQKKTWKDAKTPKEAIAVSTISGFKGMETSVGILLNVSEYNLPAANPLMASLIYVACTRAKHMLYIFVQENDPKRAVFEKALATIKATGTLTLESSKDAELIGKVTHYNPDRVGWISVDDPSFQQGSVMFFPSDVVKAEIKDLKVGSKIKFRPRAEGHVTIAADLLIA